MPRASVQTFKTSLFEFRLMKAKNLVLLLPWHSVDLVRCKPLVKEFNDTVVDPIKEEFAVAISI